MGKKNQKQKPKTPIVGNKVTLNQENTTKNKLIQLNAPDLPVKGTAKNKLSLETLITLGNKIGLDPREIIMSYYTGLYFLCLLAQFTYCAKSMQTSLSSISIQRSNSVSLYTAGLNSNMVSSKIYALAATYLSLEHITLEEFNANPNIILDDYSKLANERTGRADKKVNPKISAENRFKNSLSTLTSIRGKWISIPVFTPFSLF